METWKNLLMTDNYQVSNIGRVRSIERVTRHGHRRKEKILSLVDTNYLCVDICINNKRTKKLVHRLVAESFLPNPENKKCVNHKDGNKLNNLLENLEWCTYKENSIHASSLGLVRDQYGEKNNMSKLTESQVIDIKTKLQQGIPACKIHKYFYSHLHQQVIYGIKQGRIWSQIKI